MLKEINQLKKVMAETPEILSIEIRLAAYPKIQVRSSYMMRELNFWDASIYSFYTADDARIALTKQDVEYISVVSKADLMRILESVPYNKDPMVLKSLTFKQLWEVLKYEHM